MVTTRSLQRIEMMNSSGKFRVSLHISHPDLSADEISAPFALRSKYSRSVGAQRITKLGEDLGGVYSQTDVSFMVSDGVIDNDDVQVADFVEKSLHSLPLKEIDGIVATGGVCFFLLGIYSDGNILCDFEASFLSSLSRHGIGLKLDFYGGPEDILNP